MSLPPALGVRPGRGSGPTLFYSHCPNSAPRGEDEGVVMASQRELAANAGLQDKTDLEPRAWVALGAGRSARRRPGPGAQALPQSFLWVLIRNSSACLPH